MTDATSALRAWIARLRAIAANGPELAAAESTPLVEEAIKKTAAAGTDTYGRPWPLTKDGKRAMPNAAEHVSAKAIGKKIVVRLEGPDVYHHLGTRGEPERNVIPVTKAAPPGIAAAVLEGSRRAFAKLVGGGQ